MANQADLSRRTYPGTPILVTLVQNNSVLGGTLTLGSVYSVTSTADVFFRTGTASVTAANDGNPLWSRERAEIEATDVTTRVAFYTTAAAGTVYLTAMK